MVARVRGLLRAGSEKWTRNADGAISACGLLGLRAEFGVDWVVLAAPGVAGLRALTGIRRRWSAGGVVVGWNSEGLESTKVAPLSEVEFAASSRSSLRSG